MWHLVIHCLTCFRQNLSKAVIAGVATWKIAAAAVGSVGLVFAAGADLGYLANRP